MSKRRTVEQRCQEPTYGMCLACLGVRGDVSRSWLVWPVIALLDGVEERQVWLCATHVEYPPTGIEVLRQAEIAPVC